MWNGIKEATFEYESEFQWWREIAVAAKKEREGKNVEEGGLGNTRWSGGGQGRARKKADVRVCVRVEAGVYGGGTFKEGGWGKVDRISVPSK